MKKTIIMLIALLITLTPLTVTATPGKLKKATIIYCNNQKYGQHGKYNHWHKATAKNYATGPVLRVPCGLDTMTITKTSQSKKSITITYKRIKNISGYKIYKSTGGKYKQIAKTTSRIYTDKQVKKGKTYYYKVKAYKKIGSKTYYGKSSAPIKIKKQ